MDHLYCTVLISIFTAQETLHAHKQLSGNYIVQENLFFSILIKKKNSCTIIRFSSLNKDYFSYGGAHVEDLTGKTTGCETRSSTKVGSCALWPSVCCFIPAPTVQFPISILGSTRSADIFCHRKSECLIGRTGLSNSAYGLGLIYIYAQCTHIQTLCTRARPRDTPVKILLRRYYELFRTKLNLL